MQIDIEIGSIVIVKRQYGVVVEKIHSILVTSSGIRYNNDFSDTDIIGFDDIPNYIQELFHNRSRFPNEPLPRDSDLPF